MPFVAESFVFEDDNAAGNDTVIVASVKVDEEEIRELAGDGCSDDDIKKLIWEEVDKINEKSPAYRQIRKVLLRKKDFIHNTSSKLIRFAKENKVEE